MSASPLDLGESALAPLSLVGGKAQTLGRLERAGFRVPPGFVVPTDASLEDVDLGRQMAALGPGPFAVRSSGTAEDGLDRSLAGRYLSILDVESESVPDALARVRGHARRQDDDTVAVLIQPMVHPVCAGVAFTAHPVTGDRSTTIVTATAGLADRLVSGQVAGDEWEVEGSRVRPLRRPERVLDRKLARRVAGVARRVAQDLGRPQDVEWAWDGREVWVIQARPITGLPAEVSWEPGSPGIYHRSLRLGEWIPEPVTPSFESWLVTRMERRIHQWLYDQIGQVAPEPLHVTVNGWYFYSLNWVPAPGVAFRRNFFSIVRRLPRDWRKVAGMFPQTVRFSSHRAFEEEWRHDLLPRYRRAVAGAEESVEEMAPGELPGLIDELADLAGSYFASIAVVAGSAYKFEDQLARFWNRHLREDMGVSHMVLLQGFDPSSETFQAPRLETLDWWKPPVESGTTPANVAMLEAQRMETQASAEQILADSPRKLARFRRVLADAQHQVPVREEQLALLGLPWPVMRRALQRLGEALEASGSIGAADDIFFLTRSEVLSLLDGPAAMHDEVSRRRDARDEASRLAAPLMVGKVPPMVRFLFSYSGKALGERRSDQAIVHGVPASPGRATGRVRIVRDSSQFDDLEEGEILVAPLTAPAWTDLFSRAAAVITDVGSALAHASIIAREYGIPAVVGCGDATWRLRDGQVVTVDGSTGNVEPASLREDARGSEKRGSRSERQGSVTP